MRFASMVVAMIMATSAQAQTVVPTWAMPNAWSIGITLAHLMAKDSRQVFYVEVTAEGADLEQARQSALRMAVERAVGTIVVSETETQDLRIRRNEIITYASGYVDNHELVQSQTVRGRTQVQMKVWVSQNKLANRLLNESRTAGQIEGGRISEQIRSLQHARESGDRVLLAVLRDYPRRAFDVDLLPTRVYVDSQRQAWLNVRFNVKWNSNYIESLGTAVRSINQRRDCGSWWRACQVQTVIGVGDTVAYLDDEMAWNLFLQEMIASRPQFEIRMLGPGGDVRYRACHGVRELDQMDPAPWRFVDVDPGRVRVNDQRASRVEANIPLVNDTRNLDRVQIRVVRGSEC